MDHSGQDCCDWLVCRIGGRLCALPLAAVVETMRRLPVAPVGGAPTGVDGVCLIRGVPLPVVNAAVLLGETGGAGERLVSLDIGGRGVALAVDQVVDVRRLDGDVADSLPPLLSAAAAGVVQAIAIADGELMQLLASSRLVPEAVFDAVADGKAS